MIKIDMWYSDKKKRKKLLTSGTNATRKTKLLEACK